MVYAGTELATLEQVEARVESVCAVSSGGPATVSEENREMLWKLVEESDPELSGEEKEHFLHLLLSYADVFAVSTTDLGRTDKLQHAINTGDSPPTRQPVRRISPHRRDEVRKILDQMLEKSSGAVEKPLGLPDSPRTEKGQDSSFLCGLTETERRHPEGRLPATSHRHHPRHAGRVEMVQYTGPPQRLLAGRTGGKSTAEDSFLHDRGPLPV